MRHGIQWLALVLVAGLLCMPGRAAEEEADDDGIVKLEDILAAAQHNHAAADARYVGKQLQIQGRAQSVVRFRQGEDGPVHYLLLLRSDAPQDHSTGTPPTASFVFAAEEREGLADIQRGSMVVVKATCQDDDEPGNGLQLTFNDCKLMRIWEAPPLTTAGPTAPRGAVPAYSDPGPRAVPARGFPAPRR